MRFLRISFPVKLQVSFSHKIYFSWNYEDGNEAAAMFFLSTEGQWRTRTTLQLRYVVIHLLNLGKHPAHNSSGSIQLFTFSFCNSYVRGIFSSRCECSISFTSTSEARGLETVRDWWPLYWVPSNPTGFSLSCFLYFKPIFNHVFSLQP